MYEYSMNLYSLLVTGTLLLAVSGEVRLWAQEQPGKRITFHGYPDCILLQNDTTRVVLCPEAGGRVLEYSLGEKNALYLEEAETGTPYEPGKPASMSAGRFDIGPEKIIPRHDSLWSGKWQSEITGPRSAKLISQKDAATGVQLTREFELSETGSQLSCKQTITNVSDEVKEWCHWSRTFAVGGGIVLIPLSPRSRFPKNYVMYSDGDNINIAPHDTNIRERDQFLEILAAPAKPKLGMDSTVGWFAYACPNDLLFVKRFPVYPDRVYNEVAGLSLSIWYPQNRMVELEPIGPRERLAPGESAAFTEDWELYEFKFPTSGSTINLDELRKLVDR
jgi:hypothetical protein